MQKKSNKANRKSLGVERATHKKGMKEATPTGKKGPAKTQPKHGKEKRIPYDANHPKRQVS